MKKIIVLTFVFLLLACGGNAEEVYVPYPIIFVHGFGTNEDKTWENTKNILEKYFKDGADCKYPTHSDGRKGFFYNV